MQVLLCGPSLTLELRVYLHSTGLTPVTTLFSSWVLGSELKAVLTAVLFFIWCVCDWRVCTLRNTYEAQRTTCRCQLCPSTIGV